jgi:hypothetical protein
MTASFRVSANRYTWLGGTVTLTADVYCSSANCSLAESGVSGDNTQNIDVNVLAGVGSGRSTSKRIRGKVLFAPEDPRGNFQAYQRIEVFGVPAGSRITLATGSLKETGKANAAGKFLSRRLTNRQLRIGSVLFLSVTKADRAGDFMRIGVIARGARLLSRKALPRSRS